MTWDGQPKHEAQSWCAMSSLTIVEVFVASRLDTRHAHASDPSTRLFAAGQQTH
jgi:hypothetical protein